MPVEHTDPRTVSTHINEIIEKKPNWLIRYGIGAMLFFLLLFLVAAWLVNYPDIIAGKVNITTPRPPVEVVAKVNASILEKLSLGENDTVYKGDPILLLESTTSFEQVQRLRTILNVGITDGTPNYFDVWLDSLGSLQTAYNAHALASINQRNYEEDRPYEKRIQSLNGIRNGNAQGLTFSQKYLDNSKKDFELKQKEEDRYTKLYEKGVISASEYEQIQQGLIQKRMSLANDNKSLNTERMSLARLEREIMELELQKTEYEQQLQSTGVQTRNELKNQLKQWESQYLIISPIDGKLSFYNEVNEGDFLTAGERVLTIIPFNEGTLRAVGMFPVENAGKVKKGNKVVLKLDAYPYHEFGTVEGKITRISEIPIENLYSIVIELPDGLNTNYDKKIVFKQRLSATADIITKDQSVLQRIFYQFENLFKN